MGADTKAKAQGQVRVPGGPLNRLKRQVALEALSESGSSFGTEVVTRETAGTGAEAGAEECQRALTRKQTLLGGGGALEVGNLRLLEDGGERGGDLGPDEVACETASERQDGNGERL